MTGWQQGDGGQGNWNQPFGPDPGTNTYGADSYANQPYGGSPYGGDNPYGGEPYPYGQPEYGQTNQYPQYPTGGFPAQGYGPPPPPPKRSKLPMILSLIAIVIIVGAVVAVVLVNRSDQTAAPSPETTSSKSSEKKSSSEESTSSSTESTGGHDDWVAVDNTADAGLSYQVPPDWETSATPRSSGLDVDFTGVADYGVYDCEDGDYIRTFAASGDVQAKDGADLDLTTTVEDFAKAFATTYYGEDAGVEVGTAEETDIDGRKAVKLTASVKPNVTKPDCQATSGEIALIGVLLETEGKSSGVAMLAVVNDLDGGPSDPKPLDTSVSQEILGTVKVS